MTIYPFHNKFGEHNSCTVCAKIHTEMMGALEDIAAQLNGMEGRQYAWIRRRCLDAIQRAKTVPPTSPDITESSKSENNCSLKENDLQERS